jgi:sensor c-di-GMP phosphodiesterase-like protein
MVENMEQCGNTLNQWKNSGADIWIDDFGTGYSSLGYLHALPLDGLKIDRTFVSNPTNKHQVIETIIALANALHLETVAEGIETDEQNSYIQQMGSNYGQGYLFSHPVVLDSLLNQMDSIIEYEN